jgi:peptidoglycan/LPS O-acetylase OafA/YrhL
MLFAYALLPNLSEGGDRNISLLSTIFLMPSLGNTSLSVAWTLIHEIIFYLVFLTFFISSKLFYGALVFWALLILIALKFPPELAWYNFLLRELNIEFMMGVFSVKAISWIQHKSVALFSILLGILLAGTAAYLLSTGHHHIFRLLFALGMALLIIGCVFLEQGNSFKWPSIFLILGNASFSIYLIHDPFLSISQRFFSKMDVSWPLALVFGIAAAVLAGVLYYFLVERKIGLGVVL